MPSERALELAGSHVRLIDEVQLTVDAFAPEAWERVCERARAYEVDPRA